LKRAAGFCLVALILVAVVFAFRPGASALDQDRTQIAAESSANHPAGTDALGRDRLVRVSAALLLCLSLSTMAAVLATGTAACIALSAAHANDTLAKAILFFSDSLLALPGLFLLMIVRASLPLGQSSSMTAIITFLLLAVLGWPMMVRTIHAEIIKHRQSGWAFYCIASGLSRTRIFSAHMFAHLLPLLRTHFLICLPAFLVAEANLGALGLGIPDPLPSWGGMLNELATSSLAGGGNWRYLPAALLLCLLVLFELLTMDSKNSSGMLGNSNDLIPTKESSC
jgi:ABC-type dipeptide/oligopeptide/nickel transport system permease subunit